MPPERRLIYALINKVSYCLMRASAKNQTFQESGVTIQPLKSFPSSNPCRERNGDIAHAYTSHIDGQGHKWRVCILCSNVPLNSKRGERTFSDNDLQALSQSQLRPYETPNFRARGDEQEAHRNAPVRAA